MSKKHTRYEAARKIAALLRFESYIVSIALIGLLVKAFHQEYGQILFTISLSTLAVLYLYKAYIPVEDEKASAWEHFFAKLTLLASSVVLVGIMFAVCKWPGDKPILLTGGITLLLNLPFLVYFINKRPETKVIEGSMIIRSVGLITAAILVVLWMAGIIQ